MPDLTRDVQPATEPLRLADDPSADRLERLLALASAFGAARDEPAVTSLLVEARSIVGASACAVALAAGDGAAPAVVATSPRDRAEAGADLLLLDESARKSQPLFLPDRAALANAVGPAAEHLGLHAWAVLPLQADGQRAGAVLFAYDAPRAFGADERASLRTVAEHAGLALARIGVEQALRDEIQRREHVDAESARLNHDLQQRVREFQTLLEVLPVGIAVALDPECSTITTNRVLADLLGVAEGTNVTKSGPGADTLPYRLEQNGRLCAPQDLPMQTAARTGRAVRGFECDVVRSDGSTVHLLVNAAPLHDEQGAVRGALAAFIDFTPQRQHAERLRLVAQATNDALWDYDVASGTLWGSDAYHAFFSQDPTTVRSFEEWVARIHPEERSRVTRSLEEALASDVSSWSAEYRLLDGQAQYRHVLDRAGILRDAAGRPRRLTGSLVDLTDRMREEEALRERQERLSRQKDALAGLARSGDVQEGRQGLDAVVRAAEKALRVARVGVWLLDERGARLHRATAPASPEEPSSVAVQAPYLALLERERVMPDTHRVDGPPTCPRTTATLDAPIRVRGRLAGVVRHEHAGSPRTWTDDETAFAASVADLLSLSLEAEERIRAEHALRESESRFRTIADHAPATIWMSDAEGACVYVNRRWQEVTGRPIGEALGDGWLQSLHAEDAPRVAAAFRAAIKARVPFTVDYRIRARDGMYRWFQETGVPRTTSDGAFAGYVGAGTDTTERRAREAELDLARRQLAQSEKLAAMGSLVAGVAHEIRTPLAYMNNNAHLLMLRLERAARDHPGLADAVGRVREPAESITEGVERIDRLVAELRRFHRPGPVQRGRHPLPAVVEGAVRLFESTHRGAARVVVDAQTAATLHLDKAQLEQVVLNLLENASDVTPTDGTILVTVRTNAAGEHEVLVEDQGPGIPPEVQSRMFDPFFTTKPHGTGLGLSIVQRIVDAHDGTIRAEPREGGGTRFVVTLRA